MAWISICLSISCSLCCSSFIRSLYDFSFSLGSGVLVLAGSGTLTMCAWSVGVWVCVRVWVFAWALAMYSCCVRTVFSVGVCVFLSIMKTILWVGWIVTLVLSVCLP